MVKARITPRRYKEVILEFRYNQSGLDFCLDSLPRCCRFPLDVASQTMVTVVAFRVTKGGGSMTARKPSHSRLDYEM